MWQPGILQIAVGVMNIATYCFPGIFRLIKVGTICADFLQPRMPEPRMPCRLGNSQQKPLTRGDYDVLSIYVEF